MRRGEIWWTDLPEPVGAMPGYSRPIVIVSIDSFNASRIQTVIAAVITSNMKLAGLPGNIELAPSVSGLSKPSVINVSQLITIDKSMLVEYVSSLPYKKQAQLENSLRMVLGL